MIKLLATLVLFLGLPLHAATIKSIKGNKATLKLSEEELGSVESDSSYDMMSKGSNVGRIKVSKIFPGKGLVGVLESKTPGINGASTVNLVPAKKDEEHTLAKADADEIDDNDEEETGIKPSYGRPEVRSEKLGWDFNLQLGTHDLRGEDSSDTVYASNVGLRAIYKFNPIPLGIGGHLKSNTIKRTYPADESSSAAETELTFNSFGLSLMVVKDFGAFRPYALYELSKGKETLKVKAKSIFGDFESSSSADYLQNALIVGGAWVIGNFTIGVEYQAFGDMKIDAVDSENFESEAVTVHATGFSVNLGLSI